MQQPAKLDHLCGGEPVEHNCQVVNGQLLFQQMALRSQKRFILTGVMICILAFCGVILVWTGMLHREPRCRGMSLSEWLKISDYHNVGDGVAEVGSEAIPILAKKLTPPDPMWSDLYRRFWTPLPQKLQARLPNPYEFPRIRENILFALQGFGPEAMPALHTVIDTARFDSNYACRERAIDAALAIGYDQPVVSSLLDELINKPNRMESAVLAPYEVARFPSNCIAPFLRILRNKQEQPHNALLALGVFGPGAAEAVPLIVECLKTPEFQANAIGAIRRVGPDASPAVPILMALSATLEPWSLVGICEALMNIGSTASNAVPILTKLMTNQDVTIRIVAAAAVAKISGDANESIRVIIRGLQPGQDSQTSWTAPVRQFGLAHYSFNYRMTAAWFLGEISDSRESFLALTQALNNCPEWLAPVLARSIWKLEGKPQEVLPILRQALKAKGNEARVIACVTLAEMGPVAIDALPDLVAASRTSLNTRQAVCYAMGKIKPGSTLP